MCAPGTLQRPTQQATRDTGQRQDSSARLPQYLIECFREAHPVTTSAQLQSASNNHFVHFSHVLHFMPDQSAAEATGPRIRSSNCWPPSRMKEPKKRLLGKHIHARSRHMTTPDSAGYQRHRAKAGAKCTVATVSDRMPWGGPSSHHERTTPICKQQSFRPFFHGAAFHARSCGRRSNRTTGRVK